MASLKTLLFILFYLFFKIQAVESVYQYYQQIQNTIEQVQNSYKQIEQTATQMKSVNFSDLQSIGVNYEGLGLTQNPAEFITTTRKSAQDVLKSVQNEMKKIDTLKDSLTNKTVSFGGVNVSIADLCGAGNTGQSLIGFTKSSWDATIDAGKDAVKNYVKNLTYQQKRAIMKKFGMSPEDYAALELANYNLSSVLQRANLEGTIEGVQAVLTDAIAGADAMKSAVEALPEGNTTGQLQLIGTGLAKAEKLLGSLDSSINQGFSIFSNYISSQKAEEAIERQAQNEKEETMTDATSGGSGIVDDSF